MTLRAKKIILYSEGVIDIIKKIKFIKVLKNQIRSKNKKSN